MFRRRWLALVVALVLWGMATHGTHAGEGDEPHYLAIAHSIARDFDLDVSNNYGANEPLIGGGGLDPEHHTQPGVDGRLRPVHDVGLPLLFSPFPRIGTALVTWLSSSFSPETMRRLRVEPPTLYKHFVSATMIFATVWLALTLFDVLTRVTGARAAAFRWSALIALSSPLLVMSISFFTEVVSALICLIVFRQFIEVGPRPRLLWLVSGMLTGLLFLVHVRNAGIVLGLVLFGALTLLRTQRSREFGYYTLGVGLLFAVRTAINYRFWGTWVTSPHARSGEWHDLGSTVAEIGRRVGGMLVDQEYGLLPYAPIFVLVPYGLLLLARTNRRLLAGLGLVTGGYLALVLLPVTNAHGWTGGWSPVARFWVPIVPLLGIPVVVAAHHTPRALVTALVVLQIGINAYLWQNPKSGWNDGDGTAAICSRGGIGVCRYLPSFVIE